MHLSPVVLSAPAALATLAVLAFTIRYWLAATAEWPVQPAAPKARHGLATAPPAAYRPRPWSDIAADLPDGPAPGYIPIIPGEIVEPESVELYDLLDPRTPLAVVEAHLTSLGFTDWCQANAAILAADRELVAA